MRIYDIIRNKRDGMELQKQEIDFFVEAFTRGEIPDYQASALLMACFINGMSHDETVNITMAMARSGETADLSEISGIKADKHSTGGVGDKTSLVVCPIAAALGLKIAKMSGRGLGHTGGTIDKLESIPGLRTDISRSEFIDIVKRTGIAIVGQSGNFAPADKKLYALRDVTATVDSIPLITSSIMSKKLAAGADCIVLDVKTGSGSFMKSIEDSRRLARSMVDIGKAAGKRVTAVITDMDKPLGNAIGNSLEVIEAVQTLRGYGPLDFTELCVKISAYMLELSGKYASNAETAVKEAIESGRAFYKFVEMVEAQGGDIAYLYDTDKFEKAPIYYVKSDREGYIHHMDIEALGRASLILGAGRNKKDDIIDYSAGITVMKKTGDYVSYGETVAMLHTNRKDKVSEATELYLGAVDIKCDKPKKQPIIYDVIG